MNHPGCVPECMTRPSPPLRYTPLMLASFHNNVWLVRHIMDTVGVDPNHESQRTLKGADTVSFAE